MKTAKRIDEFTPDRVSVLETFTWLAVKLTSGSDYQEYKALSKIAEFEGKRFYKMSYNSDTHEAYYKEAKDKPYHERYI